MDLLWIGATNLVVSYFEDLFSKTITVLEVFSRKRLLSLCKNLGFRLDLDYTFLF